MNDLRATKVSAISGIRLTNWTSLLIYQLNF
jgi:hypothetical protein